MTNSTAPERDMVLAEEVEEGSGKWLVTLMCGHKKFTKEKKVSYKCFECVPGDD